MGRADEMEIKDAIERFIDKEVDEEFLDRYGAHAVSIGRKNTNGKLCLVLYVEPGRKPPRGTAPNAMPIDPEITVEDPRTGKSITILTDVVEETVAKMHKAGTSRIVGGDSCMAEPVPGIDSLGGTIGGWVWDQTDHTFVVLSNMHVFGEIPGRTVYHPSFASRKRLGAMKRGAWRIGDGRIQVDCAVVEPEQPRRAAFKVRDVGPAVMAMADPEIEMRVEKVGQVTGRTHGRITDPKWSGRVLDLTTETTRMFFNCMKVVPVGDEVWTQAGDSGSLVFASEPVDGQRGSGKAAIGLHVGGPDSGRYGIACRIGTVFEALSLATLPEGLLIALANDVMGDLPADATPAIRDARVVERGALITTMLQLADYCRESGAGRGLRAVLDRGRVDLVETLAHDRTTRRLVARLLRRVFFGRAHDDVLSLPVDRELLDDATAVAEALAGAARSETRRAVAGLREGLHGAEGGTIGEYLRRDSGRPSRPPRRPDPDG